MAKSARLAVAGGPVVSLGVSEFMVDVDFLLAQLQSLDRMSERKTAVRSAARKALRPIFDTAKALAPVDTGKLERGMKIRKMSARQEKRRRSAGVQISFKQRSFFGIDADAKGFYPVSIELGWTPANRHGKGSTKVPATKFMRRAFDMQKRHAKDIFTHELQREINKRLRNQSLRRTAKRRGIKG